jgi:hypothetical protein
MMEGWKVGRGGRSGAVLVGAALLSILPTVQPSASAQDTLPIGYGTLKRDDIVVRFATDQIAIQVLPLAESVIRLLAPDTYASLQQLLKSKRAEIEAAAQRAGVLHPMLVMVTFLGVVPQARFNPDDLNITSLGRLYRPAGIVPLSPRWSSYQLDAREQAVAIYLFEEGISFRDALSVSYQDATNDSWTAVLRLLDRERSQVLARAQLKGRR